jgi:hypothetical protein
VLNVKIKVIPVIIGATEIISKLFTKYFSNTTGMRKSRNYRNSHTGYCQLT